MYTFNLASFNIYAKCICTCVCCVIHSLVTQYLHRNTHMHPLCNTHICIPTTHMLTHTCTHTHVHTHAHTCMHTHTHAQTHMLTHACTCKCRSVQYKTLKLFLIGKAESGKTTLLRRLKNLSHEKVTRTTGIEIEEWYYPEVTKSILKRASKDTGVHFVVWDCVGQVRKWDVVGCVDEGGAGDGAGLTDQCI